ncbi:Chromatin-remodeling ATPase INO80 like protein [Verticillium longisporum]|nr:Chromatin-remodeling ATPase INO80 like protein [Verticillium longisporum]
MWLADDDQAEMIERREKEMLEAGEFDKPPGATKKKAAAKRKRPVGDGVSLDEMYHEGEGNFDDKQASGTATPVAAEADAKGTKKRRGGATGKKAKSMKQRLAIADGQVDG